jgi:hypothetical protein
MEYCTREYKETVKSKETTQSTFLESIYLFSPALSDKFPTDSSKSKFEEFSDLNSNRKELYDAINEQNSTLKSIRKANKLDSELPEAAKDKNAHFLELKKEYPAFFDEESGNSSVKDGLRDLEQYVKGEKESLLSEFSKVNADIKKLIPESSHNDPESSKASKRNMVESDADDQPSAKKISNSNEKDLNSSYSSQNEKDPSPSEQGSSQSQQGPSQTGDSSSPTDQPSFQYDDGGSFWDFF